MKLITLWKRFITFFTTTLNMAYAECKCTNLCSHVSIYTVLILFYTFFLLLCVHTALFRGYIHPFKQFLMNQRHVVRILNKGLQTSATICSVACAIHTTSISSSHEITLLRSGHWISSFQTPFQTEACSTLHLLGFPTPSSPSPCFPASG